MRKTLVGTTVAGLLLAASAGAVTTSRWTMDGADEFRECERKGIAVHGDGRIVLGPESKRLLDEADFYVWALHAAGGAVFAGTGDDGKVYRIAGDGKAEMLWDTAALEVTSLASDRRGALYAGTAPDGAVLARTAKGVISTLADTPEQIVWAIVAAEDGTVFAATGNEGRIYRMAAGREAEVFFEAEDGHVLCLVEGPDGTLFAGTGGRGLLYAVRPDGTGRVLYDAEQEEIRAIAVADDGRIYFAANAGSPKGPSDSGDAGGGEGEGGSEVTIGEITLTAGGGGEGETSLYMVRPDGAVLHLWSCPEDFIYALNLEDDGRVLVATGDGGGLYRVSESGDAEHVVALDEAQALAFAAAGGAIYVGTGNPGRVLKLAEDRLREGTITSGARDGGSIARWGSIDVEGDVPSGTRALVSTRSGNTREPDGSWTAWSEEVEVGRDRPIASPAARFLQWRLRLIGDGSRATPAVGRVSVAYVQQNLPPRVAEVNVAGKFGEFVSGDGGRPGSVTRQLPGGIEVQYSIGEPGGGTATDEQLQWVRGLRSATWDADDPNGDDLVFRVEYRAEGDARWILLEEDLTEAIYTWDTTSFADGRYELRVIASDEPGNTKDAALEAERVSKPFDIDNTPPAVRGLSARFEEGDRLRFEGLAVDGASRIRRLAYAVDGGGWSEISPEDGVFDSTSEAFRGLTGRVGRGEHAIVVKAVDEGRNIGTARVVVR
jgi:hypothetical protein